MTKEKYVRCEAWNTARCVDSLSNCYHRIPHEYNQCCDGTCGEVSKGCIPGSFNIGDRYRLFGNIIMVTEIVEVCDARIITVKSDKPFLIITAYEDILIKILSRQIGV